MKQQLEILHQLQLVDTGIAHETRLLSRLDDGSGTAAELAQARAELEQAEADLHKSHGTLRDRELQLGTTEGDRAKKYQQAQHSTNAKEVDALEHKVAELDRMRGKLEEQIILLLDEVEGRTAKVEECKQRIAALEATLAEQQQAFAAESQELKGELSELKALREKLVAQVEPQMLSTYEELRKKYANLAIAEIVHGVCVGCHTQVPSARLGMVKQGSLLVRCEVCHRLLYGGE